MYLNLPVTLCWDIDHRLMHPVGFRLVYRGLPSRRYKVTLVLRARLAYCMAISSPVKEDKQVLKYNMAIKCHHLKHGLDTLKYQLIFVPPFIIEHNLTFKYTFLFFFFFKPISLTFGSREMILTVLSDSPTAKKRHRCSPGGTRPSAMHTTSAFISLRSVYSFSWPVCKQTKEISLSPKQDDYLDCIKVPM